MNNQKKKSWFSYLFPYIILISIIVVIVLIVNGGKGSTIKYSEGEIIAPVTEKVEGDLENDKALLACSLDGQAAGDI